MKNRMACVSLALCFICRIKAVFDAEGVTATAYSVSRVKI